MSSSSPPAAGRAPAPLVLVRHGESEWNALKRWQGQADSPLSDTGRRQAAAVAARLAAERPPIRFGAVWSSDLRRARTTAEVLAPAVGVADVRVDERLREAAAGPWEGLTPTEIERRWPGWLAANRRPDGFEPAESVVARAVATCNDLLATASTDAPVLAVTHSGLIRTLRRHLGLDDLRVPNLGGVWVDGLVDGSCRPIGWFDGTLELSTRPDAVPAAAPDLG